VFRIARRRYASPDGEGARRYGGRCNYIGIRAVYASQNVSLAALEVLVHIDRVEIPNDYVLMGLEVRDAAIPDADEAEARRVSLGKDCPVLRVASVVVPRDVNYVLYPDAPGLDVTVLFIEPFTFDPRLFAPPNVV